MISISSPFSKSYKILSDSRNEISHTGDLIETTLKSVIVPGGCLGANGGLRYRITFLKQTTGNGSITYRVNFGGTNVLSVTIPIGEAGHGTIEGTIYNTGSESVQAGDRLMLWKTDIDYHDNSLGMFEATANDKLFEFTIQLANVSSSGYCKLFCVEVNQQN